MSATLQVTEEPLADEDILLLRRSRGGVLVLLGAVAIAGFAVFRVSGRAGIMGPRPLFFRVEDQPAMTL
mgnify:FL=1